MDGRVDEALNRAAGRGVVLLGSDGGVIDVFTEGLSTSLPIIGPDVAAIASRSENLRSTVCFLRYGFTPDPERVLLLALDNGWEIEVRDFDAL